MDVSTGLFLLICSTKSPRLMGMLKDIAEFEYAMVELSAVTGLSVKACADVVRNTCKDTDHSWEEVAA
jgi:hypothetical protein